MPSPFYVDRYARGDLGTATQLAAGSRDRPDEDPVPRELLDRLLGAWRAMRSDAASAPPAYEVSGEWRAIINEAFRPLTDALDAGDRGQLDRLLRNFFRLFGDFFGEPTDLNSEEHRRSRQAQFRVYASRWIDLYGESQISDVHVPLVSNPIGFCVNGGFITRDSFRHNFYARRMADLVDDADRPIVCEVGGGFGGCAYHTLRRAQPAFRYIDYDLPVMCIVAGYYLATALPAKELRLYGEVTSLSHPLEDADIAVLPNFALPSLADRGADICFNTCSFAEMSEATVREYTEQFERIAKSFILYEDHTWSGDSPYAYYQPAGFSHWDVSAVRPSTSNFKRVHKIPSPFHSDFLGEFFEWLYQRRQSAP